MWTKQQKNLLRKKIKKDEHSLYPKEGGFFKRMKKNYIFDIKGTFFALSLKNSSAVCNVATYRKGLHYVL